jgi:hypothetical protein
VGPLWDPEPGLPIEYQVRLLQQPTQVAARVATRRRVRRVAEQGAAILIGDTVCA